MLKVASLCTLPALLLNCLKSIGTIGSKHLKNIYWAESINFIARQESFSFKQLIILMQKIGLIFYVIQPRKKINSKIHFNIYQLCLSMKLSLKSIIPNNFLYLRSLLRIIGVIPVFMGTNFNASNFLSQKSFDTGSRPPRSTYRLYLVYKLPPISQKALLTEFNTIYNLVSPEIKELNAFLNKSP